MVDEHISMVLEDLCGRKLEDGGFASFPGGEYRPDAAAWAILALAMTEAKPELVEKARSRLASDQLKDGRLSISPDHPDAYWPTALAILAWQNGSPRDREAQARAVRFLMENSGLHWQKKPNGPVGHDTAIRGWPWVDMTHSWVEPTSLAVMALTVAGHGGHERVQEALLMLMDRQLPGGGWNYGNTLIFGKELFPMADATGMALNALSGRTSRESIAASLEYLRKETRRLRTPLSLGWGLLGLGAWGERPEDSRVWVMETLQKQDRFGPFDTSLLSLLLIAFSANTGLVGILAGRGEQ
jgi:hypothetical protein